MHETLVIDWESFLFLMTLTVQVASSKPETELETPIRSEKGTILCRGADTRKEKPFED